MVSQSYRLLAASIAAGTSLVAAGPCDIYASGGTPCVAAHGTTRALYNAYNGPLYQVTRGSDGATIQVRPLSAGGVANAATQDNFCKGTTCTITTIYDQSGRGNHLTVAPPGGAASGPNPGGYDEVSAASGAPVTLNGSKAYGVFIHPLAGYRNNAANGTATGDQPQGMYAIFDGTHYNGNCCFDYGNAEVNSQDTGNGHMEAIYFGLGTGYGTGSGRGPWVLADLENGLYADQTGGVNQNLPTITNRFVTAVVKGRPGTWSIRGGDSCSGGLTTWFSGNRPANGYNPMKKEGAIILGIGGDNSNTAQGTFYEGVMTSGYPTDATENSVQANIVAAKYATTSLVSGPALQVGSSITFRVTTPGYTNRYLVHNNDEVDTAVVSSSSSSAQQDSALYTVRAGLANSGCVSFESVNQSGSFLRHSGYQLRLNSNDGSKLFAEDATYCPQAGLNGQGNSFRSYSYPTRYFRHYAAVVYIGQNGGPKAWDSPNVYNDDVSWVISSGFSA